MFHTFYIGISFACCFLSIVFNFILTEFARKRAKRVGIYRYFTYSFVITDVIYSISFAIATPFWYSAPGVIVFFAASPFWENYSLMQISMLAWWISYVIIILCLVSSFLYRYGLLCNPAVLAIFMEYRKATVYFCSVFLFFIIWMTLALVFIFHSSNELREDLRGGLDETKFHVNFSSVYCLGVKVEESNSVQVQTASIILLAMMLFSFVCIVYCGYKIHYTVVNSIMSEKSRRMHACALRMIIAQAVNPTIFLYMPGSINMMGLVSEADPGWIFIRRIFACLFGLFPVMNPLIIVYFTEDYKRLLLGKTTDSSSLICEDIENNLKDAMVPATIAVLWTSYLNRRPSFLNGRISSSKHSTNPQLVLDVAL